MQLNIELPKFETWYLKLAYFTFVTHQRSQQQVIYIDLCSDITAGSVNWYPEVGLVVFNDKPLVLFLVQHIDSLVLNIKLLFAT